MICREVLPVMAMCVAVVPGNAFADNDARLLMEENMECAAAAAMIGYASPPMEAHVMSREEAKLRVDKHLRNALEIGVPLIEAGEPNTSSFIPLTALGGSAEAGLGLFYAGIYDRRSERCENQHGSPDSSARDMGERFEALKDWYRQRASVQQFRYEAKACEQLIAGGAE